MAMLVRMIDQTVLPATLQNPDPSCNMRASSFLNSGSNDALGSGNRKPKEFPWNRQGCERGDHLVSFEVDTFNISPEPCADQFQIADPGA